MALFDDDDDQQRENESQSESGSWGVDESSGSTVEDTSEDPLAGLDTATIADDDPNGTLKRAVDPEAGVVIYAYKNGNAGGLSAVPLNYTDLDAGSLEGPHTDQ